MLLLKTHDTVIMTAQNFIKPECRLDRDTIEPWEHKKYFDNTAAVIMLERSK